MARYFFHTEGGEGFPDEHGVELADLNAARAMALKTMCEMASALKQELWRDGWLRVTVVDEAGLTLMTLDLAATSAPAVGLSG